MPCVKALLTFLLDNRYIYGYHACSKERVSTGSNFWGNLDVSDIALAEAHDLTTGDEQQLVTMTVDNQMFGIPILKVQDIVEPDQITPVPLAPGAIAGVLNLRGRIVTVIDLRACLGAPQLEDDDKQMSVTVEYKGDLYTLLVDSIGDVRSMPRKSFDKPPATLDASLRQVCAGIYRLEEDLLVVLDVERTLAEETINKTPRRTWRRKKAKQTLEEKQKEREKQKQREEEEKHENKETERKETAQRTKQKVHDAHSKAAKSSPSKPKLVEKSDKTKPKPSERKSASGSSAKPEASGGSGDSKPASGGSTGGGASAQSASEDPEAVAMQAVEVFAAKADGDPVLSDLFKDVSDPDMLDLLVNLFNAAFKVPGAGNMEQAYLKLIQQPGLEDDHFVNAGTAMHSTLVEVGAGNDDIDRIMKVIDETRVKVLDT